SGIETDVWIRKRADRVRLFKAATRDHVVEDQRNAERAYLNSLVTLVLDSESQYETAIIQEPRTRDLDWSICRKSWTEVGGCQRLTGNRQRLNWFSECGGGVVSPGVALLNTKGQVTKMKVAIGRPTFDP